MMMIDITLAVVIVKTSAPVGEEVKSIAAIIIVFVVIILPSSCNHDHLCHCHFCHHLVITSFFLTSFFFLIQIVVKQTSSSPAQAGGGCVFVVIFHPAFLPELSFLNIFT